MSAIEQPKEFDEPSLRLLEQFTLPIWRSRLDAQCDYFNKTWLEFTGRTLEQELGDGWIEGVHPDDRAECLAIYLDAFHSRRSFVSEYRLRRHDGEYRWLMDCGSPFDDSAGHFAGYLGVCYDITSRKEAEQALRKSEKLFAAFMSHWPGFAWMKDLEGRYTYANAMLAQLEPYREGWLGKTDVDLWPAEIASAVRANDETVIATAKPLQAIEQYLRDNEVSQVLVSKFPIFGSTGSVEMVGGASIDITEKKQAEMALAEQVLRYRTLMETSNDSIYVVDANGDLQEANVEFLRRRGYSAAEAKGLNVVDWDPDWTREALRERLRLLVGGNAVLERRHRCTDGSIFDVEVGATSVRIADKELFFCVTRDITERKQAEEALRKANRQLQILSRRRVQVQEDERKHLARELHDQIGQALTATKISIQSAKRSRKREAMTRQLNDAMGVLDQILLQVRQMTLHLRPPALDDLGLIPAARLVLDDYARRGAWHVQFLGDTNLDRPDAEVETVCFRIILEALTNVLRHAKARQVSLELQKVGDVLHLVVRDDSVGFNVPDADKWIQRDCLGLIGMRERATAVGGSFEYKSMPEQGTEIHAFLPCHLA